MVRATKHASMIPIGQRLAQGAVGSVSGAATGSLSGAATGGLGSLATGGDVWQSIRQGARNGANDGTISGLAGGSLAKPTVQRLRDNGTNLVAEHESHPDDATLPIVGRVTSKIFSDQNGNPVTVRYGWEIKVADGTRRPAVINGRQYTGHAIDRMQGRGIMPSVVEDTIAHGISYPGYDGKTVYYNSNNNISVILNSNGDVVTASHGRLRHQ